MAKNTKDTSSRIDLHHTHHHRSDMRWDMGGRQRGQQILSTKNMAQEEGEGRAMVWLHRCCAGATGPRAGRHKERRRRTVCRLGGGDTSAEPRPSSSLSSSGRSSSRRSTVSQSGFKVDAWTGYGALTTSHSKGGVSDRWYQVYIFIFIFSYM